MSRVFGLTASAVCAIQLVMTRHDVLTSLALVGDYFDEGRGTRMGYGPATETLARLVFDELNHADPGDYPAGWAGLDETERDIYRDVIEVLAGKLDLLAQSRAESDTPLSE